MSLNTNTILDLYKIPTTMLWFFTNKLLNYMNNPIMDLNDTTYYRLCH